MFTVNARLSRTSGPLGTRLLTFRSADSRITGQELQPAANTRRQLLLLNQAPGDPGLKHAIKAVPSVSERDSTETLADGH